MGRIAKKETVDCPGINLPGRCRYFLAFRLLLAGLLLGAFVFWGGKPSWATESPSPAPVADKTRITPWGDPIPPEGSTSKADELYPNAHNFRLDVIWFESRNDYEEIFKPFPLEEIWREKTWIMRKLEVVHHDSRKIKDIGEMLGQCYFDKCVSILMFCETESRATPACILWPGSIGMTDFVTAKDAIFGYFGTGFKNDCYIRYRPIGISQKWRYCFMVIQSVLISKQASP